MSAPFSALSFSNAFRALVATGGIGICLLAAIVWGQASAANGEKVIAGPQQVAVLRAPEPKAPATTIRFGADGTLKRPPADYRKWVAIGTPLALHEGEAQEFHAVYMDPDGFAHYEKAGQFRDGTVLVKEAVGVGSANSIAGKGYFMGEFTGLQVAIKDSKRFKNEPGNWAYFDFGNKYPLKAEALKEAAVSCNECHQDNAKADWVFSQYYPVLRTASPRSK